MTIKNLNNSDNLITIFTPTYNRADLLNKLYKSLLIQNERNFEWVVVDDGSTDDTEHVINSFINDNLINITYLKQSNKGKHIAINKGLDVAKGKWFLIVDSDDYLTENALSIINEYLLRYNGKQFEGYVFRRANENNNIIGDDFPNGKMEFEANMIERTVKYKISGDMAEVFQTDLLKKCRFDEIEGERFCAEGLMWNRTAKLGAILLYINKIIYKCEYLPGGLTANSIINRRKSPQYATLLYKELSEYKGLTFPYKLKAYINYWRFSFFVDKSFSEKIRFIGYSPLIFFSYPIGFFFKLKDDLNIKKNGKSN